MIMRVWLAVSVSGAVIVGEDFSLVNATYGESGILQPSDVFGVILAMGVSESRSCSVARCFVSRVVSLVKCSLDCNCPRGSWNVDDCSFDI